jgi:hypothetical protein
MFAALRVGDVVARGTSPFIPGGAFAITAMNDIRRLRARSAAITTKCKAPLTLCTRREMQLSRSVVTRSHDFMTRSHACSHFDRKSPIHRSRSTANGDVCECGRDREAIFARCDRPRALEARAAPNSSRTHLSRADLGRATYVNTAKSIFEYR